MNQGALCSTFQEFFDIKVNDDAVALGNVLLRLGYCLFWSASIDCCSNIFSISRLQ